MSTTENAPAERGSKTLDLARVVNPSEMVTQPGFIMRRLGRRFAKVTFDLEYVGRINEAASQGNVVYVCERQSTIDYLFFNYVFLKFGLPLAYFANGVRTLLYRQIHQAIGWWFKRLFRVLRFKLDETARLAAGTRAGRANLLFLHRRRSIVQWGGEPIVEHLARLIQLQGEQDEPIMLVPLSIFWDKQPEKHRRTLGDFVFGDPNAPGRLRKLLGFLRFHRSAAARVSEPLNLKEFLEEHGGDVTPSALAERLLWNLHRGLSDEARPLRGPILKRSREMCAEIMRSDAFRNQLKRWAEDSGRSSRSVEREVHGYLKEIAANFSLRYVEGLCLSLTFLWNRLFSGFDFDEEGLAKLREAGKKAPIVFIPAHRSHLDYLAISYVCYTSGLIAPHIAAGINLSFWPMGHIFRRCGAFFLRRSFKGNPLYSQAFAAYVRKLVKEGYWLEFFIEGGRSRTGKTLPPKMGMLTYVVQAVLDGAARDVNLVPCSIGYERIVEEGAYSRELGGEEKKSENLGGLVKSSKVLGSRYGRMYLNLHDPMSLREFIDAQGFDQEAASEAEVRDFVNLLGHRLAAGINRAVAVTTTSLVATALMCHPKRGISMENLRMRVGLLLEIATREDMPLASALRRGLQARRLDLARAVEEAATITEEDGSPAPLYQRQRVIDRARGEAVREAIDEALKSLVSQKLVREDEFDGEKVFTPVEERRINLDIYKNAFLHLIVPQAFAATGILATHEEGLVDERKVGRAVRFLSRLLKYEFVYGERSDFDRAFAETKTMLFELGLLVREGDDPHIARIHPKAYHLLRFFRNVTRNFLESYWLAATRMPELIEHGYTERDLKKRLQQESRRAFREGDLVMREAVSSVNFQNAIAFFRDRGFLEGRGRDKLTIKRKPELYARWADHIRSLLPEGD